MKLYTCNYINVYERILSEWQASQTGEAMLNTDIARTRRLVELFSFLGTDGAQRLQVFVGDCH